MTSSVRASWLADVLRAAGLSVVEHDGWKARGHGDFTNLRAVVWHHDASPKGASPGVPGFMLRNWSKASANCWVALDGTWHLLAAGVSYHAGRVLPGKPGNKESIGVETDHTTGESWSGVALLDSLRRGTAAILARLNQPPSRGLEFHKTICSPVGRKTDPDGLDLLTERHALVSPAKPKPVAAKSAPPKPAVHPWPGHPTARGSKDRGTVQLIQKAVRVKVDGDYGPKTADAVRRFQKARKLGQSGTVDRATWRALFGA